MKLIAPFGFYGWGNIGDEATLQGFARLVDGRSEICRSWIGSRNPRHTRRVEPQFRYFRANSRNLRRKWAWFTSDAVVVPGGTPISDVGGDWPLNELEPIVSRAHSMGKPLAFVGTGTEHLLRDESRRLVSESIAPRVTFWTVRSEADRRRLVDYGVAAADVVATADLAWMLDSVPALEGRAFLSGLGVDTEIPIVGVNVNIEHEVRARQPQLLNHIAQFLDWVIESHRSQVVFMCNETRSSETFDLAASREVMSAMKRGDAATLVPNEYWSPQFMMSLIGCCRATISTRYHYCLFSALQRVPFLAVARSGKVQDLCDDLQWPFVVPLGEVAAEALRSAYGEVEMNRTGLGTFLHSAQQEMRKRSNRNHIALEALKQRLSYFGSRG